GRRLRDYRELQSLTQRDGQCGKRAHDSRPRFGRPLRRLLRSDCQALWAGAFVMTCDTSLKRKRRRLVSFACASRLALQTPLTGKDTQECNIVRPEAVYGRLL